MPIQVQISVAPEIAENENLLKKFIAKNNKLSIQEITEIQVEKKSIDARSRNVKINIVASVYVNEKAIISQIHRNYQPVTNQEEVFIIGAGPAGLFAALKLIELGKKPIVFERGKDVRTRRRDLAALNKQHLVNEESNYCFGEGGAGTYSDGKLYTRSTKKGNVKEILETFVFHGADKNILVNAHPHIGTNKLPEIITKIRASIESAGGEIHFNSKLTGITTKNGNIDAITINNTSTIKSKNVILATGHSARDVFYLLKQNNINIEAKPFALGVRIEHPQSIIDRILYHCETRSEYLPPAPYSLVTQVEGRGVYSFCMCPGGIIAPCATHQNEIVTNGWSPSKRNNPYANAGTVVAIELKDVKPFEKHKELAALEFQKSVEQKAWLVGGKAQTAPAQRLVDFVNRKNSASLPDCSYHPGIVSADLYSVLPDFVASSLKTAIKSFAEKMKGYYTNEAVMVATESRTSSPVRIPRNNETLEHIHVIGLYPCGEGAGYAGGIVSAAIDGQNCAIKIAEKIKVS
jgi:uncharacterized protein